MNKNNNSLILVLNCGSSSIKYAVINPQTGERMLKGLIENIQSNGYEAALDSIWPKIECNISAIGHRVVHGGEYFSKPTLITEDIKNKIQSCIPLAPLHNPANLLGIERAQKQYPKLSQIAVFDTAFHQSLSPKAYLYPLPYSLYKKNHIRRYGFHGTSHEYVMHNAAEKLNKSPEQLKLITAHLGNGCSLAAIKNGESIDTSMGFTPLEGVMMGTRCGDIDPSIVLYLQQNLNYSQEEINNLLNKQSGLLGISELSNDMRELNQAAESGNQQAQLAIDMFCYKISKTIGSYFVALNGIDGLIFTGGIGENAENIRDNIISQIDCLGEFEILVINTDEELMIARETQRLLSCP